MSNASQSRGRWQATKVIQRSRGYRVIEPSKKPKENQNLMRMMKNRVIGPSGDRVK
jgi:hypothetical protein